METPGDRVLRLRKIKGWSQAQLASRTDGKITQRAISHIETDKSPGSPATFAVLAPLLETSPEYLAVGLHPVTEGAQVGTDVPVDGRIDAAGQAQGQRVSQEVRPQMYRSAKDAFTFPHKVPIAGARDTWWVMTASDELTRGGVRAGDQLVIAPGVHAVVGDWVLVTSDTDEYHELFDANAHEPVTALRQLRKIDGERWLWPLGDEKPDLMESYWRVLGVVVEHRRRPDLYQID